MQIRLVSLEQLRQDVEQMERQIFVDTYPGAFLLALPCCRRQTRSTRWTSTP